MAKTSISGASAYCTNQQVIDRCDVRTLGQWLSDDDTPLTPAAVLASTLLTSLAQEASGDLEAALLVGGRYVVADLAALTGNSLMRLVGIAAWVTVWKAWSRRPRDQEIPAQCQYALDQLAKLESGENILAFQEVQDAGNLFSATETSQDVEARNGFVYQSRRYWGRRGSRVDLPGRGAD